MLVEAFGQLQTQAHVWIRHAWHWQPVVPLLYVHTGVRGMLM
jgi:hypothetical protein